MQITKIQRGRTRTIQVQVLKWRKQRKRFETEKDKLSNRVLNAFNGDLDAALLWFNTPNERIKGKRPKELFNPINLRRLKTLIIQQFGAVVDTVL